MGKDGRGGDGCGGGMDVPDARDSDEMDMPGRRKEEGGASISGSFFGDGLVVLIVSPEARQIDGEEVDSD